MSDLLTDLRSSLNGALPNATCKLLADAADEIEKLRGMHQDMCRVAGGQVDEIARLKRELRDHQYSGGADWAQMAADVDRGRGQ